MGRHEQGVTTILWALLIVGVLTIVAIVVDLGHARQRKRQLQNATDAAALAGAAEIGSPTGCPNKEANSYTYNNLQLGPGFPTTCTGVSPSSVGRTDISVTSPFSGGPPGVEPSALVNVRACEDVPTTFAKVINVSKVRVCANATARQLGNGSTTTVGPADQLPVPISGVPCTGPVVDGRITSAEGYRKIGEIKASDVDFGDVFAGCDGTHYFFAMRLNGPTTGGTVANENVYGEGSYHEQYTTGWEKHDFGALRGSDRARFQVSCATNPVHDFVQDYLREKDGSWLSDANGDGKLIKLGPASSSSSMVYNLTHPVDTRWGDGSGENPQSQSPPLSGKYPNFATQYNGWVWEMLYEFSVPKSSFQGCFDIRFALAPFESKGSTVGNIGGIHNSPPKTKLGGSVFSQSETGVILVQ